MIEVEITQYNWTSTKTGIMVSDDDLVKKTIPIYNRKNPHPTKNRTDCPMEIHCKQGWRMLMLRELNSGGDREAIIEKYKQKVEQL